MKRLKNAMVAQFRFKILGACEVFLAVLHRNNFFLSPKYLNSCVGRFNSTHRSLIPYMNPGNFGDRGDIICYNKIKCALE